MGTVPGRPPGSRRPLAGTMGSNTWHSLPPPHEYVLCFLEWGAACVSASTTTGTAPPRTPAGRDPTLRLTGKSPRALRSAAGVSSAPSRHPAPDAGSGRLTSCPRALAPRTRRCVCSGPGMAGTRLSHNLPPPPGAQLGWGGGQSGRGHGGGAAGAHEWAPGRAKAFCRPQKDQCSRLARPPPLRSAGSLRRGRGGKWGSGERGLWAGAGDTQGAQVGSRFWFSESRDSFACRPCSRCSFKGSQSGKAVGPGLPFKACLAPPCSAAHGRSGSLASVCHPGTAPPPGSQRPRPPLRPGEAAEKARV